MTSPADARLPSARSTSRPSLDRCRRESVCPCPCVELADEVAGRCEEYGVEPCRAVGRPRVVRLVSDGAEIADVDACAVGVEPERTRVALAHGEGGRCLGRVVEATYFGEGGGAELLLDVAQDPARADGGELLVVADQAYDAATLGDVSDCGRQLGGGCLAGLVDDDHRVRADLADPARPLRCRFVGEGPGQLGQGVGVAGDGLAEFVGGLGGRREADHLTAALGPGVREDAHRGGLAGPGRSEGELDDSS